MQCIAILFLSEIDHAPKTLWREERATMRNRIHAMREGLVQGLGCINGLMQRLG